MVVRRRMDRPLLVEELILPYPKEVLAAPSARPGGDISKKV